MTTNEFLLILCILLFTFIVVGGVVTLMTQLQPDPMVIKIMKGDLPPCETTVGTPTGYYCQVNKVSMFCKVDITAADPYVRTHPYCTEMVWI